MAINLPAHAQCLCVVCKCLCIALLRLVQYAEIVVQRRTD